MTHAPRLVTDLLDLPSAEFAMESTPDRCALLDEAGRVARTNRPWDEALERPGDPVALATAAVGEDYLAVVGRVALHGNRDAGTLHAQIRAVLAGDAERARIEFERPLRSGGTVHSVATVERVRDEDAEWILIAFTESDAGTAQPTSVPEAGFSVPAGARFERLVKALDATATHAAILDDRGRIVAVNAAWRLFGIAAGADENRTCEGTSYLAVCESAAAGGDARAAAFGRGLGAVLRGERHTHTADSHVGLGGIARRYRGRATELSLAEGRFVLVTHTEIQAAASRPAAAAAPAPRAAA
ncbi:MAG: hypothetical protein AAGB93_17025 [Planctomycetota bacterium]